MNWRRPFFILWIGQAFSLLGSQLVQFALVWWLTRTTGSAAVLATASLIALLPNVFLSSIAGPLAEVLGVRFWYVLGGLVCVLMGTVALMTPKIVNAERVIAERLALQVEQAHSMP